MPHDLPKAYDPTAIEDHWAEYWVREKLFAQPAPPADAVEEARANQFSILLPPPNVTGNLHMGHMFEQTESDILTRWHRMRGERVLWIPGTDHAGHCHADAGGAADRRLKARRGSRWAAKPSWSACGSGARTTAAPFSSQMKRLGARVDWSREYFTMDERLSVAVREAFVKLHEQGLIYRGAYIVNWCPRCQTAISDLEVVYDEHKGHLWEIRYPVHRRRRPRDGRVPDDRHDAAGDHAGRRGGGDSSRGRALHSICTARSCGCRWWAARFRSCSTTR